MIKCTDCGAPQYEGTLFCEECGNFLLQLDTQATAVLPFSEFAHRPPPPPLQIEQLDSASKIKALTIVIPSSRRRVKLNFAKEVRVGRADPGSGLIPELDLTQDGGAENGVSRLHATFKSFKQSIVLIDLGSTNGTLLNTYRLPPDQPYPVKSGDEVRFGDLLVHLFFEEK
ncbi:MAG: FHA domain-containing protein [Chloroflexi bacterium]|nr:FHA domain-containing protein [Chloroflexota bacterium]